MCRVVDILIDLSNQGYTVEELKNLVIKTLDPYFDHPEKVTKYWTSAELLSAFEFIVRYHYDHEFSRGIMETLSLYKSALVHDEELTLSIICNSLFDFAQKENMMWSVRENAKGVNTGDHYEIVMRHMKHIGDILEIGVKHFVYELLALIQVTKGIIPDYEKIVNLDFGVAIQNILDQNRFRPILTTIPLPIKLSDWRNIAYHHTYRIIDDNLIQCIYGKKKQSFLLNTEELKQYTHNIVRSSNILSIARGIFIFDYIDEISKYSYRSNKTEDIRIRDSIHEANLRISMLSQRFLLERIFEEGNTIIAIVIDLMNDGSLTKEKEQERYIHSSQLLYEVWRAFSKDQAQIRYANRQGVTKLISTVDGEVCQEIQIGKEAIQYMVRHVKFKFQ